MTQAERADKPLQDSASPAQAAAQRGRRPRSGLGRGLEALIPEIKDPSPETLVMMIDVDLIDPNPYQPRVEFSDEAFHELVASVEAHGVLQPVIVRDERFRDRFVLIAGERRWRAAVQAGLAEVPALIIDATPQEMLELALVENVVRSDLTALEEAIAYRQLIDDFGLTQQEVAQRVGRSRVSVTNTLRLLFAPDAVKTALQDGRISEGHARALLSLPSAADQVAMLQVVISRGMSVRQAEQAVRQAGSHPAKQPERLTASTPVHARAEAASERLRRALSTRVTVKQQASGKGSIAIRFDSDEQLQDLVTRISGERLF